MAKIVAYKCDNCDYITPFKDEIFVLDGYVLNGENEIIISSSNNKMFCFECFTHKTNLLKISEETNAEAIDESNEIRELIEYKNNIQIETDGTDIQENSETDEIEETDIQENSETDEIEETDIQENSETEEIEETDIQENSETDQPSVEPKNDENIAYILIKKIKDKDHEFKLINKLGYKTIEEFQETTKIKTLIGLYVPTSEYISDDDFENQKINETHGMEIVAILYNVTDNFPMIKKSTVLISQDKTTGFISYDALQLLIGN